MGEMTDYYLESEEHWTDGTDCPDCLGEGGEADWACPTCAGTGSVQAAPRRREVEE